MRSLYSQPACIRAAGGPDRGGQRVIRHGCLGGEKLWAGYVRHQNAQRASLHEAQAQFRRPRLLCGATTWKRTWQGPGNCCAEERTPWVPVCTCEAIVGSASPACAHGICCLRSDTDWPKQQHGRNTTFSGCLLRVLSEATCSLAQAVVRQQGTVPRLWLAVQAAACRSGRCWTFEI